MLVDEGTGMQEIWGQVSYNYLHYWVSLMLCIVFRRPRCWREGLPGC